MSQNCKLIPAIPEKIIVQYDEKGNHTDTKLLYYIRGSQKISHLDACSFVIYKQTYKYVTSLIFHESSNRISHIIYRLKNRK